MDDGLNELWDLNFYSNAIFRAAAYSMVNWRYVTMNFSYSYSLISDSNLRKSNSSSGFSIGWFAVSSFLRVGRCPVGVGAAIGVID